MAQPLTPLDVLCRLLSAAWQPENLDLPQPLPWNEIADLAQAEGVGPLLRAAIQKTGLTPPDEVRARLDHTYFQTAKDNILRFHKLAALLDAFSGAGIPAILLKGAALIGTVYANTALRPMVDLDLLVPPEAAAACREILTGRGYSPYQVPLALGYLERTELAFTHPEPTHPPVDLHWHLFDVPYYTRRIPTAWLWQQAQDATLAGRPIRVLNPEATLLHLAAHLAFHHRFHGLRWFADAALLLTKAPNTFNWEHLITTAQTFSLLLPLRETLDRLAGYWPSLPLAYARQRLNAVHPTLFEQHLFRLRVAEPSSPLWNNYVYAVSLPDYQSRLRFILLNLFPPAVYMVNRYGVRHRWHLPYWHLRRLVDGLSKAATFVPRLLQKGFSSL